MSKMKAIAILLIVLIAASAFAGGGQNRAAASGKTTLNLLYYLEATNPTYVTDGNWVVSEFERLNPDVTIQRENLFSEPYHDKLRAYAASGNLPDVAYVWPSGRTGYLQDQKLLKDLMPFVQRDNLTSVFQAYALDPAQQQGGYLGMIPISSTATNTFWYNLEVLNDCGLQPAKTYAELKAQVPVLRAKGYDTVLMGAMDDWVIQSCLFSMVAGRFCGVGWDERIFGGTAKFTDPDFVAGINFIKIMFDDGVLNRNILGIDYSEVPGLFASNKYAYMIEGSWRVGPFITDPDTKQALISPERQKNIKIALFPDIDGVKINQSNSTILGSGYGMSSANPAGSAKEDAAWRLVKWLTGKECQARWLEHGLFSAPSRSDINLAAMPFEPLQLEMMNLKWTYDTIVIDGPFGGIIEDECNVGMAEIGMGLKTPQQVAQDLQRAYDAWKARH